MMRGAQNRNVVVADTPRQGVREFEFEIRICAGYWDWMTVAHHTSAWRSPAAGVTQVKTPHTPQFFCICDNIEMSQSDNHLVPAGPEPEVLRQELIDQNNGAPAGAGQELIDQNNGAPAGDAVESENEQGEPANSSCPGLQAPRPDGGIREIDVFSMAPDHVWSLFTNTSVNGGYLGKSVVHHMIQKHSTLAYPGGKFCKTAIDFEQQRLCFVEHCADAAHLRQVHEFIVDKIPSLLSLRTKMRCVNVPQRLVAAAAGAAAAAAEPEKATLNENLYCRVTLFVKWSQVSEPLLSLFNRYYGNEQSRTRHGQDNAGYRCATIPPFVPSM
jgi:hypothetical protein